MVLGQTEGRKEIEYVARTKDGNKTRTGRGETEKAALEDLKSKLYYESDLAAKRKGYPKVVEVSW